MPTKIYVVRVEIDKFKKCEFCDMYSNCTQTYHECRAYKKHYWKEIDNQFNQIRRDIYEKITEK